MLFLKRCIYDQCICKINKSFVEIERRMPQTVSNFRLHFNNEMMLTQEWTKWNPCSIQRLSQWQFRSKIDIVQWM